MHTLSEPLRPVEVERLRGLLRKARPALLGQGWSKEEVDCIGPTIKAAIDGNDAGQVRAIAMWMGRKLLEALEGVAVQPVLPLHMEVKRLDREWKRGQE